ncbi:DUF4157 domain-containing protein [Pseudenhygromyxa sp. WMMC2535]|nr:DUF4157 domain-containing protein [Pseudenhygromyxa sp. WMMC2535]
MGAAFDADFSSVRVSEGPEAGRVGARAFTRGEELHFGPGEYRPQSAAGQRMIGHELAHVVQQRQGRVRGNVEIGGVSVNTQAGLEREADGAGERAARGEAAGMGESSQGVAPPSLGSGTAGSPGVVQRREDEEEPGFSPEGFKRAMRGAFRQAGVYELIQHRQEREPDPNESDWPAHASAEALVEGRSRLRSVGRVNLGPIDVTGHRFVRPNAMPGHEFADLVASLRQGIAISRGRREDLPVVAGDTAYARESMNEWARMAAMVSEGHVTDDEGMVRRIVRLLYDNWRNVSDDSDQAHRRHAEQAFKSLENLGKQNAPQNAPHGDPRAMNVHAQAFERAGMVSPHEYQAKMEEVHARIKYLEGKIEELKIGLDATDDADEVRGLREVMRNRENELDNLRSFSAMAGDKLSTFAYRMNPAVARGQRRGTFARLSLNMDSRSGAENVRKIHGSVSRDTGNIEQSKIMGPMNIGRRVDDAVVYLKQPGLKKARGVSNQLNLTGPELNTAPPGMDPIASGVAYAEYVEGSSSSHGNNRGEMITNAVMARLGARSGEPMAEILGGLMEQAGYNPNRPSRVDTKGSKFMRAVSKLIKKKKKKKK